MLDRQLGPDEPRLLIMPVMPAYVSPDGRVELTRKFLEGMRRYAEAWPGRVCALLHPSDRQTDDLDAVWHDAQADEFEVKVIDFRSPDIEDEVASSAVVLAGADHLQHDVVAYGERHGVPVVYTTECTLKTRCQIVCAEERKWGRRLRRILWEARDEGRRRRAISRAQGLQANGTPTYNAYADRAQNPLLFFDGRTLGAEVIGKEELASRLQWVTSERPLRLVFTGRLHPIKGVDDLPRVARHLRDAGLAFTLDVIGGGECEAMLREAIAREHLEDQVRQHGTMDFRHELVPWIKEKADLFLCPHRQGDPSCTYLETLSCGVPIVGYNNEAFAGVLGQADVGWGVRLNDAEAMARRVLDLEESRAEIAEKSSAAVDFANGHCFERTFAKRVEHLIQIAQ